MRSVGEVNLSLGLDGFSERRTSWRPVLSQRDGRCRQTLLSPTDPIEVNCDLPLGGIAMEGH